MLMVGAVLMLAACASDGSDPGSGDVSPSPVSELPPELAAGSEWILVGPDLPGKATLTFGDGQLSGRAQVNSYTGTFTAGTDGTMTLGPVASTKMAGPPELMKAEEQYFALLQRTTGWEGDGVQLTLRAGDETLLRYGQPGSPVVFGATLVGKKVGAARAAAEAEGYEFRVISVDGDVRPVTLDYRPQRLNAVVVDGRVTEITVG
jgi:heat shock protein HslJ